jgi:hypothetical protein
MFKIEPGREDDFAYWRKCLEVNAALMRALAPGTPTGESASETRPLPRSLVAAYRPPSAPEPGSLHRTWRIIASLVSAALRPAEHKYRAVSTTDLKGEHNVPQR